MAFAINCSDHLREKINIKVISGGFQDPSARIGIHGVYGGAYKAKLNVNGKIIYGVEKRIVISDKIYQSMNPIELEQYLDINTEIFQLAARRDLAPKFYGYRDQMIDGRLVRHIYMEEVGRGARRVNIFKKGHLKDKSVFHLFDVELTYKYHEAKKLLNGIQKHIPDNFQGAIYEYLLDESQIQQLLKIRNRLKRTHPDFHTENVMIYFVNNQGKLEPKLYGIDWTNALYTTDDLKKTLEKLKIQNLDQKIKRDYDQDYY